MPKLRLYETSVHVKFSNVLYETLMTMTALLKFPIKLLLFVALHPLQTDFYQTFMHFPATTALPLPPLLTIKILIVH